MKENQKRALLLDIKHHIDSLPALAKGLMRMSKKLPQANINESVCKQILELSKYLIKTR